MTLSQSLIFQNQNEDDKWDDENFKFYRFCSSLQSSNQDNYIQQQIPNMFSRFRIDRSRCYKAFNIVKSQYLSVKLGDQTLTVKFEKNFFKLDDFKSNLSLLSDHVTFRFQPDRNRPWRGSLKVTPKFNDITIVVSQKLAALLGFIKLTKYTHYDKTVEFELDKIEDVTFQFNVMLGFSEIKLFCNLFKDVSTFDFQMTIFNPNINDLYNNDGDLKFWNINGQKQKIIRNNIRCTNIYFSDLFDENICFNYCQLFIEISD